MDIFQIKMVSLDGSVVDKLKSGLSKVHTLGMIWIFHVAFSRVVGKLALGKPV